MRFWGFRKKPHSHCLIMLAAIISILLAILVLWLYFKFFKIPKIKNIVFIDGSLGSGKSFYSVALAIRLYKRAMRRYKVKRAIFKLLDRFDWAKNKLNELEEPVLYSSILLRNIPFVKITKDLLFRINDRFAYGSVVLLDEFSLIADQMMFKDKEINERLSLFFKLFRHETKGGYLVINSQSINDCHFALKYCLSDYFYIHHKTKFPFFSCLKIQEMAYAADPNGSQVVNARNEDIEETCKNVLVWNKYYRYYDTYCYSCFTDMLPVLRKIEFKDKKESLKDYVLVSFKEYQYLTENLPHEE